MNLNPAVAHRQMAGVEFSEGGALVEVDSVTITCGAWYGRGSLTFL